MGKEHPWGTEDGAIQAVSGDPVLRCSAGMSHFSGAGPEAGPGNALMFTGTGQSMLVGVPLPPPEPHRHLGTHRCLR